MKHKDIQMKKRMTLVLLMALLILCFVLILTANQSRVHATDLNYENAVQAFLDNDDQKALDIISRLDKSSDTQPDALAGMIYSDYSSDYFDLDKAIIHATTSATLNNSDAARLLSNIYFTTDKQLIEAGVFSSKSYFHKERSDYWENKAAKLGNIPALINKSVDCRYRANGRICGKYSYLSKKIQESEINGLSEFYTHFHSVLDFLYQWDYRALSNLNFPYNLLKLIGFYNDDEEIFIAAIYGDVWAYGILGGAYKVLAEETISLKQLLERRAKSEYGSNYDIQTYTLFLRAALWLELSKHAGIEDYELDRLEIMDALPEQDTQKVHKAKKYFLDHLLLKTSLHVKWCVDQIPLENEPMMSLCLEQSWYDDYYNCARFEHQILIGKNFDYYLSKRYNACRHFQLKHIADKE